MKKVRFQKAIFLNYSIVTFRFLNSDTYENVKKFKFFFQVFFFSTHSDPHIPPSETKFGL